MTGWHGWEPIEPLVTTTIENNLPILAKILNAEAKKHRCRFKYDPEARQLLFHGDPEKKEQIISEVKKILAKCLPEEG